MKIFALISGAVLMFVIANYLAMQYGETRRLTILAFSGLAATCAYYFFGHLAATKGLSVTSAVVDILIVVGSVALGILFRGERLTLVQSLGILLGLAATPMILLSSK